MEKVEEDLEKPPLNFFFPFAFVETKICGGENICRLKPPLLDCLI